MTTIAKIRKQNATDKTRILQLLGWNELQYGEFQMQSGEAWIKHYLGKDAYGIEYLVKDRIFWKWWINQWNQRDADFITYAESLTYADRMNKYLYLHSPELLHNRPHSCLMEATYSKMIGLLIDNLLKTEA